MDIGWVEAAIVLGGLAVLFAIVVSAVAGNRPRVDRFLEANALPHDTRTVEIVGRVLRRTSRGRLLGAIAGGVLAAGLVGAFGPWAPWVVVISGVLVGTFVGIAVAQVRSRPATGDIRSASLDVRDLTAYRPRRAVPTIVALVVLLAGYGVLVVLTANGPHLDQILVVGVVVLAVAVVAVGRSLQRRVVERARDLTDSDDVRVDDALRADVVRALHHVVVGLLCCSLAVVGYLGGSAQRTAGLTVGAVEAIGWYLMVLGFLAALYQWGRASKSWRRGRPRIPTASSAGQTVPATGNRT